MALNVNKSKEAIGGYSISDSNGITSGFYTSGAASPIGNACPVPTVYLQTVSPTEYVVWHNTGPLGTDWVQLGSSQENFSYKTIDTTVTIPINQEMIVSCLEVTATGCLVVDDGGCFRILG